MCGFEEALSSCCCCCDEDDEMAGFKEPDLWRYFNAPMANDMNGALVSSVDFSYEETDHGVKVTQVSTPLVPEPKFMGTLSSLKQMPPLRQIPQDDDLGKRESQDKPEKKKDDKDQSSLSPFSVDSDASGSRRPPDATDNQTASHQPKSSQK